MNTLRNRVQLIGHLGTNPELKELNKGAKVTRLSLATNESYKNSKGEKVTETYWHNLVAWGKTAEIADKILKKGCEVAIEGKLINRSYEAKDGSTKYITEIQVSEFVLLKGKE